MIIKDIYIPVEKEYDEITEVWEASVRATHDFLSENYIALLKQKIRNEYLYSVSLYAIKTGENIIAFMGIDLDKLEMLFVHPRMRGKAVGSCLLKYAIGHMGIIYVDVNEQNSQALGFYRAKGFSVIGRSEKDGEGMPFPILHLKLTHIST